MPYFIKTWDASGESVTIEVSEDLYRLCREGQAFFVQVENAEGIKQPVEVSRPIYDVFQAGYRAKERRRKEVRNHLDGRGLDDYTVQAEAVSASLEDLVLQRQLLSAVSDLLHTCTAVQGRRFCLKRIFGYTVEEIARLEKCSLTAIRESIAAVDKKIKNIF